LGKGVDQRALGLGFTYVYLTEVLYDKQVAFNNQLVASQGKLAALQGKLDELGGNAKAFYRLGNSFISPKTAGVSLEGFLGAEAQGRWTDGICKIRFLCAPVRHLYGTLRLQAQVKAFYRPRKVEMVLNGTAIGTFEATPEGVEVDQIVDKAVLGFENLLEFRSEEKLYSPFELGVGSDKRKLGLRFTDIYLAESFDERFKEQELTEAALAKEIASFVKRLRIQEKKSAILGDEIKKIKQSVSFKIGRMITFLPRLLLSVLRDETKKEAEK
jgi:hypothetical protein